MSILDSFVSAIQNAEWGSSTPMGNNPGNLNIGDIGYGTFGSQNLTVFPSLTAGQAALSKQANAMLTGTSSVYSPSMTIAQAGALYSGSQNGNWANNVSSSLGVPSSTTLSQLAALGSIANGQTSSSSGSSMWSLLGAKNTASSLAKSFFGGFSLEDAIVIVVGLILIAAGVFAFDRTQSIVQSVAKSASKLAEVTT